MAKYRKKPIIIEAEQWVPNDDGSWPRPPAPLSVLRHSPQDDSWEINTLEGTHEVSHYDWIIKGVKGELYPCKPDIFELTYELAE